MGLLSNLFGGGGNSGFDASKQSSTSNTTNSSYVDSRSVNDAGGGMIGTGNQWTQLLQDQQTWDSSNSGNTSWDSSNSGNTSWDGRYSGNTSWEDNSDRSSYFRGTDNSDRSTNWTQNVNTTDGGAFTAMERLTLAQTGASRDVAMRAFDSQDRNSIAAIQAAMWAQENALTNFGTLSAKALGMAESNSKAAFDSSAKALGMQMDGFGALAKLSGDLVGAATKQTAQAASQAQAAFNTAADQTTGNRTLILAGLAAVAVVALVAFGRK